MIAHQDVGAHEKGSKIFNDLKLVCQNIKRSYEIRKLVLNGVGETEWNGPLEFDHKNIVQALRIQKDMQLLMGNYHQTEWMEKAAVKEHLPLYSNEFDYWRHKFLPDCGIDIERVDYQELEVI